MRLERFPNIATSTRALADAFENFCGANSNTIGLVLPGGRSAMPFMQALVELPLPWHRVLVTVGDERCVPQNDNTSNIGQVRRVLVEGNTIAARLLPWFEESAPPERLVETAARRLAGFPWRSSFAVLATAPDGHVASLFPDTPLAVRGAQGPVVATQSPSPPRDRLSLTLPAIAACDQVALLVYGRVKKPALESALNGARSPLGDLVRAVPQLLIHAVEDSDA